MPVACKKQQQHQRVEQHTGHRQIRLRAGVINLTHRHAHLGINGMARQLGDIEEKVHHQPQQISQYQL